MEGKILILDIDGTLTNSKKEITQNTLKALIKIQELGNTIILASGRPTHGVKHISDLLQLDKYGGYILSFNGARIMNAKTKKVVYQQCLPNECIKPLYEYACAHDMGLVTYQEDKVITGTRVDSYMEFEAGLNKMDLISVEDFVSYVDFDINKCLFTAKEDVAPQYEIELAKQYDGVLSVYRSEPFFVEAMPLGIDKAASLERLFQIIGVNKSDTIACGDGFNDMSMIEFAGVGVAMANAQEPVKQIADYVTKRSNDEDGLVEVVEKFFGI